MEAVRSAGLRLASMAGHGTIADGLNDESNHDRIEAELIESIDLAVEYDIPGLIVFSGNSVEGQSREEAAAICARGAKRVIGYAEEKGINLNMELLNSKVDHPGYECDHTVWGVDVCQRVGSPWMKLLYDIYHMQIMEGDITRTIREHIGYIGHFHTAGNPGRHELDESQELNYAAICRAVRDTGYDLYVGHEFTPSSEDWRTALEEAHAMCDV